MQTVTFSGVRTVERQIVCLSEDCYTVTVEALSIRPWVLRDSTDRAIYASSDKAQTVCITNGTLNRMPTPLPTLSAAPTEVPTVGPTDSPSFRPTYVPSMQPTLGPTLEPTLHPTIRCGGGEFLNIDTFLCTSCVAGKFRSNASAEQSECLACPVGRISSSDRAKCDPCTSGKIAIDGISCGVCSPGKGTFRCALKTFPAFQI